MPSTQELLARKCRHADHAIPTNDLPDFLAAVPEWRVNGKRIERTYQFKNYYENLAFINAIAYVVHAEDHHPEITLTYNRCTIQFDTHSVNQGTGGLSDNDFICAAKVDAIFQQSFS